MSCRVTSFSWHSMSRCDVMSKQKSFVKSPILPDGDEQLDPQDLNPFSFREFLRSKNQDQDPEQDLSQVVQLQSAAEEEDEDEGGQDMSLTFDPEVRSCFFLRPSLALQEEATERWGRSLKSGVAGMSFFCTEEEETRFSCKPEDQQGGGAAGEEAAGWAREGAAGGAAREGAAGGAEEAGAAGGGAREGAAGGDKTSIAGAVTSCSRSQIQQMEEENLSLRRSMRELQRRSDANERRVLELSEELVQMRRQEEKEAQDLESMVQSVEQNLRLMTVEVDSLQSENDSLKAAESEIVMTMRNNAQVASEYLNKTASHAHSSIRQLLGETETLCLVSQLLKSIDKISELDSES
ncbi:endosome-associated-trafficking regulator 1 isoform X3 [Pseudoliparis swirei]|uniref:endosome-associated-trafficking regulator 1 isoform X3 n=1 Tax=Pseudoliparis swirei TaxID=2059687 RepID=UPI0024BE244C|nr:endosome-associated-trafficking regulator 1 isoform X3 [Pseudoliparis swirei]